MRLVSESRARSACRLGWVVVAAAMNGCGKNDYPLVDITGKVMTCEGKPAVGGTVVFYPIDDPSASGRPKGNPGREARGVVGEDGTFKLTSIGTPPQPGVVTGRHTVEFLHPPMTRPKLTAADKAVMGPEEIKTLEAEYATRPIYPQLPCSLKTSPAEVTVTPEQTQFEFTLNKKNS